MDFVDEQHRPRLVRQLLQHGLETLFEIPPVFGARQQGAHVEGVHLRVLEYFRDATLDHATCEAFGNCGLADASLTDKQRIVLASPAQNLNDALDFFLTTDQRVNLADQSLLVKVLGVVLEGSTRRGSLRFAVLRFRIAVLAGSRIALLGLGHAMRNEVHNIQAGDVLPLQEINRMRVLLAKDGHQHVGASDFLLARRLHVEDGALDDALESEGRLGVDFP